MDGGVLSAEDNVLNNLGQRKSFIEGLLQLTTVERIFNEGFGEDGKSHPTQ